MSEKTTKSTAETTETAENTETTQQETKAAEKMYSQSELNAREASTKKAAQDRATKDLLKTLGLTDISQLGDVAKTLEAARKAEEASQTEAERREKADKKAATERAELERQLAEKDAAIAKRDQMDAIREAGITDRVTLIGVHALVTAMVNDETDFNAALATFLADEANAKYTATTTQSPFGQRQMFVSTGGKQNTPPPKFNMNDHIRNS